jgi:hypothetical protein
MEFVAWLSADPANLSRGSATTDIEAVRFRSEVKDGEWAFKPSITVAGTRMTLAENQGTPEPPPMLGR